MVDPLRCAYHEARLEKLLRKYDYKNVPMGFPVASVMQLETVMIALIGIEKPALVHCARGADRTGLVAAAVRIEYDSWPVNRAVEEMHDPKFGSYNFASYERVLREWAEE
jgi:protein-tyrosine phosphatase